MDYEFFLRLALKGYRFFHISYLMADFRWHAGAKSSQATALQVREREQALIVHDSFLNGIPVFFQRIRRFIFMILSRFKRMLQKLFL